MFVIDGQNCKPDIQLTFLSFCQQPVLFQIFLFIIISHLSCASVSG